MLRKGSTIIAGVATNTKSNSNTLLSFKWSDHIINSLEWLRADTFSWQSGSVYTAAYAHLTADLATATSSTETIAGYTITVYTATDGHKIVLADQINTLVSIYDATGVAWYYVVDTANTQFKLPRSKHNKYTSQLAAKGNGLTLGLWDGSNEGGLGCGSISGIHGLIPYQSSSGALPGTGCSGDTLGFVNIGVSTDATKSGIVADVPEDTSMYKYLYFYVGEYSQSATEQTAGLNSEMFNQKVDINSLRECHVVVESYTLGNSWARVYDDGWVEQGDTTTLTNAVQTITLMYPMRDSYYFVSGNLMTADSTSNLGVTSRTTTLLNVNPSVAGTYNWEVKGFAAE